MFTESKMKLYFNMMSVPSSQPNLAEGIESSQRPSHPLALNVTTSQELTESPRSTSPQSSAWGKMDSLQRPTEKSKPWTSPWLISATQVTSPRGFPSATKLKSPQQPPTPFTKSMSLLHPTSSMEWGSLPQPTIATKLMSPYLPTSATKPALPHQLTLAMESSSAQQPTTVLSPQLMSAIKTVLTSPPIATGQPASRQPTTAPLHLASPQRLVTSTKLISSQWVSSAALSSSLHLIKTTNLISSQPLSIAMKVISARQPTLSIKSKYLPQFTEATNLVSPQPLTTATKQTPPRQPTAAIKPLSVPQLTKLTAPNPMSPQPLTLATELTFPWQQTKAVELISPKNPAASFSSQRTLPLTITQPQQPFSDQGVSAQTAEGETDPWVSFKGSFQLVDEMYHPNYSDPTSDSFQNKAMKLETIVSGLLFSLRAIEMKRQVLCAWKVYRHMGKPWPCFWLAPVYIG